MSGLNKRRFIYAYILPAEKFWNALREEMRRWLPEGGVATAMGYMKSRFPLHYVMFVSTSVDSIEVAKRLAETRPEEAKDWKPIVYKELE